MFQFILTLLAAGGLCLAAGDAKSGQEVYNKACKSCHGADGAPNPAVAKMMKVEMRHLGDPAVQGLSNDKWKEIITAGAGKMKPVKSINTGQADDVITFGRTLKK
jgi:mono/diheme cytochrome c family protein